MKCDVWATGFPGDAEMDVRQATTNGHDDGKDDVVVLVCDKPFGAPWQAEGEHAGMASMLLNLLSLVQPRSRS